MKLSISNIAWSKEEDEVIYEKMKQYGFEGLEIAPTRIIDNPYENCEKARSILGELGKNHGFTISSMQSILFGRSERLFASEDERVRLKEYTKKAIDFASMIGCRNLVFGSPRNRVIDKVEDYPLGILFFKELGGYAEDKGVSLNMEANPQIYGTNYITHTKEALRLVKEVSSKGFKLNLDFGTILENKEDLHWLESSIEWIGHVHISEPYLAPIVKRAEHHDLAKILKGRYEGYVSVEMKRLEDKEESILGMIESTLEYIGNTFVL